MRGKRKDPLRSTLARIAASTRVRRASTTFLAGDTRKLLGKLPDQSVHCVITSPPYAELKDYGRRGQLGFGQGSHHEYLDDLGRIFRELRRVCKRGASMWIVIDTVKASGKTLLLPWETINRAQEAGWSFEDLIIWDKGRSLPWSHVGRFRGVFEYVLLFSNEGLRYFAVDNVREIDHLSPYWVRFPERCNPHGKAPSDLWHFPIPVQGSWSRNGIRHYCPFPVSMVGRMIAVATKPGQVILDPFAGTGTVLAVASYLGRHAVGIDINASFVRKFDSKGLEALIEVSRSELGGTTRKGARTALTPLMVRLRVLKSPRTLFSELSRPDRLGKKARSTVAAFVLTASKGRTGSLGQASISILARRGVALTELREQVAEVLAVPPLSKFRLNFVVRVVAERDWRRQLFFHQFPGKCWFSYAGGNFHNLDRSVSRQRLSAFVSSLADTDRSRFPPILSTLKARVESPPSD